MGAELQVCRGTATMPCLERGNLWAETGAAVPDVSRSPAPSYPPSTAFLQTWKFYEEFLQATERSSLSLSTTARGVGLGCRGSPRGLTALQPAWRSRLAGQPVMRSAAPTLGLSLFQADLMKPSLQMKHNFEDRHVVGRSGDDVCLFLLVSSCLFNYRRC